MQLPSFKGILAFDAVARLGSVSKAAEELNLTVSAVSHQISNLEAFVDRQLFHRSPRGLHLTHYGEQFERDISSALTLVSSAVQNIRLGDAAETLRIHAVPTFASLWLMPRLPAFRVQYPDVRIQLAASYSGLDFSRGDIDVAISYGAVRGRDLHVEALFSEEILPMISPALKKNSNIRIPQDLIDQNLILSEVTIVQWPHWFAAHGVPESPASYCLSFDRTQMALDAASQGLGIVLDSHQTASSMLKSGVLVPVFPDRKAIAVRAHYLVYPRSHAKWRRVAHFADWLRAEAASS